MKVINYTAFRAKMKDTLDSVTKDGETVMVNRNEKETAVIISLDEYNGLMETLHLMKSPANKARLDASIARDKKGLSEKHALIEP